jgi:hypothetical protein
LRSRKQLEDILTKRIGSLEILETMLLRVESAAGDIEVGLSCNMRCLGDTVNMWCW